MRRLLLVLVVLFASGALAQNRPPPKLDPLPEPPPPPELPGPDEQGVLIDPGKGDKVEEIREGGRVVMLKVTPPGGKPYYLVDTTGSGNWTRRDSLDDGVRVPQWPILQWE